MALSSRASSRSQRKLPLSVAALGFLGGPTAHLTTTPQLPAPSTCSFLLSKGPLFSRPGGLKETRDSPSGGQHFRCYRVTYTPPHIFLLTSYMLPRFADLKSKPYTLQSPLAGRRATGAEEEAWPPCPLARSLHTGEKMLCS